MLSQTDTQSACIAGVAIPDELIAPDGSVAERVEGELALVMGYADQLERVRSDKHALDHSMLAPGDAEMLVEVGLLQRTDTHIEWGRCADYELTSRAEILLDSLAE
jgi:hypothetical protein